MKDKRLEAKAKDTKKLSKAKDTALPRTDTLKARMLEDKNVRGQEHRRKCS